MSSMAQATKTTGQLLHSVHSSAQRCIAMALSQSCLFGGVVYPPALPIDFNALRWCCVQGAHCRSGRLPMCMSQGCEATNASVGV